MHGEIKLKRWLPFSAEQVICWRRGMIWNASVNIRGISIRGGDRFLDGVGAMRWALFGVIPIINASGADITRSAAGRVNIESLWLPSVLCADDVLWTARGDHLEARFEAHGEPACIEYEVDAHGALRSINMARWGNPDGGQFRYENCGAWIDDERTFNGYTIPSRLRVGWYFGSPRFDSEGEFFRASIDRALYR